MDGGWGGVQAIAFLAGFGILSGATACSSSEAFDPDSVITSSCSVAKDQRGSFMAKVGPFPLHLKVDSTFVANERIGIETAVAQWNVLAGTLGYPGFFELQYSAFTSEVRSADPRDCEAKGFGAQDTFSILRETSAERWTGLGFNNSVPGATLRCYRSSWVDHQVVLLYATVIDPQQFSSVILHELGHSLGLDHSCVNVHGRERFVGCSGLAENHPYRQAVMFPLLRSRRSASEQPEIKDWLRENDSLRTGCLYGR
jgi:hypothetical protein